METITPWAKLLLFTKKTGKINPMPEGHSIHRLANAFTQLAKIGPVVASSPQGRFSTGAALIDGLPISSAWAWGKHLFLQFGADPNLIVHIHLGLYGSWKFSNPAGQLLPRYIGAPRHRGEHQADKQIDQQMELEELLANPGPNVRLRLFFGSALADLSGPNTCEVLDQGQVESVLSRLGPDPLAPNPRINGEEFVENMRKRKAPIAQLVMDQKVVAGPGNIYRAECLFRTGINPHRGGNQVSKQRLFHLWEDLVSQMRRGLHDGHIITIDDSQRAQLAEKYQLEEQPRFFVYQRTGESCWQCQSLIREEVLAGRRNYWCPTCQH